MSTRGGDIPLRVEVTDEDSLFVSVEVPRRDKLELLSFGVIAVATALANDLDMRTRPLMRTMHLRNSKQMHIVNIPDAVEVMAGERIQEFIILLRQLLAGSAR